MAMFTTKTQSERDLAPRELSNQRPRWIRIVEKTSQSSTEPTNKASSQRERRFSLSETATLTQLLAKVPA